MTVKVKGDMLFKDYLFLYINKYYITKTAGHTCTNQSSPPIPCTAVLPVYQRPEYQYQLNTGTVHIYLFTTNKSSFFQCLELWYFKIAASIRFLDCTN